MQSMPVKKKTKGVADVKKEAVRWLYNAECHGVHRLIEKDASWYWIPSLFVLFLSAVTLVCLTVTRFEQSPTYLVRQESGHTNLPFPAVIICPEIHFPNYKKIKFLSNLKYPEGLNQSYILHILPQLGAFFSLDVPYNVHELEDLEDFLQYNNIEIETAGRRLTLSCEETLIRCRWQNDYVNCADLFHMEVTGDGFCCVFNGRSLRREIIEMAENNTKRKAAVWPTYFFGFMSGLAVAINQSQAPRSIDLSYKWIALEPHQRYIDTSINGTALNPGSEQWLVYRISSNKITNTARYLNSNLRKCRMSQEPLKYFPYYRKRYCNLECEIASTMKLCQCVRVVHPNPHNVNYCNAEQLRCANHAIVSMSGDNCHCPSTCDVDTKVIRVTSFILDPTVDALDRFYSGLNFDKVTVVRVSIQDQLKKSKERHSYFRPLDLFSQLGGMFNAFFGCSILTILGFLHRLLRIVIILCGKLLKKLQ